MRKLEKNLGYAFVQKALLRQALTHPSAKEAEDNQRLEFLGDAVLEFCISDLLYRKYPQSQEGELTAHRISLVCEETLYLIAKRLELGDFLRMGHGEQLQRGHEKPSILADALEAVLAAVYLDGGAKAAQEMVFRLFEDEENLSAAHGRDDKGLLQEYTQATGQALPEYAIVQETGPAHNKGFLAQVSVMGNPVATGEGSSKKAAEQAAAREALKVLQKNDGEAVRGGLLKKGKKSYS